MNSYKRLREGIVLSQNDQDPYAGVLFHETPLALKFFTFLFSLMSESCVNLVFIIGDILTAFVLGKVAELIATNLLSKVFEKSNFEYPWTLELIFARPDIHVLNFYPPKSCFRILISI